MLLRIISIKNENNMNVDNNKHFKKIINNDFNNNYNKNMKNDSNSSNNNE